MSPGILLVTRNGLALSKRALRSALAQDLPAQVLVVENDSSDGTRGWLKSRQAGNISVLWTLRQESLAWCWNSGLRSLWTAGCTEALVINNDVELRPDTLSLLLAHGGEFVTAVSVDTPEAIGIPGDRDIEVLRQGARPHPDMSCFLVRKTVTDKIGWFDEAFFPAYCEDLDWHIRLERGGIKALCIDVPFYHYAAGTLKSADVGESLRIRRGADRNREYFRKKWGVRAGSPEYYALFGASAPPGSLGGAA